MTDTHLPGFAVLPSTAKAEAGRLPQLSAVAAIEKSSSVQPNAPEAPETLDTAGGFRQDMHSGTLQPRRGVSSSIVRGGGHDIASLSRKRRDLALANTKEGLGGHVPVLPSPRAMPGARLKMLSKTPPLVQNAGSTLAPMAAGSPTVLASMSARSPSKSKLESESLGLADAELRRLREEIRIKDQQLQLCRAELQKRNEEFEGCVANLNVSQAELTLCQERLDALTLPVVVMKEKENAAVEDANAFAGENILPESDELALLRSFTARLDQDEHSQRQNHLGQDRQEREMSLNGSQSDYPKMSFFLI